MQGSAAGESSRESHFVRKGIIVSRSSVTAPLFPDGYRASGILLHVTSLPSPYGIGDFGPVAVSWIDRLAQAGQSWWQALPLGPTGYGNSPYQPLSSFAGNALVISPDWLIEDELLKPSDTAHPPFLRLPSITIASLRLSMRCSKKLGTISRLARVPICTRPMSNFARTRIIGLPTTLCSAR